MPIETHGTGTAFAGIVTGEVLNAVYGPQLTVASILPWVPSQYTNPQYAYLTDIDGTPQGSPPTDACGPCQRVGELKTCTAIFQYGLLCFTSNKIDPAAEVRRFNQGDPDYELVLGAENLVSPEVRAMLTERRIDPRSILEATVALAMLTVARSIWREVASQTINGDGSASGALRKFVGLSNQIVTGHTDALDPSATCPALDSILVDFNSAYDTTDTGGFVLARLLSNLMFALEQRAARLYGSAEFAIVMAPDLYYLLSQFWYAMVNTSYGATIPSGIQATLSLEAVNRSRDEMLGQLRLVVNGRPYRVIPDPNVPVSVASGTASSNIYVIPLRAGGRPVTYFNYLDYKDAAEFTKLTPTIVTDNRRILWYATQYGPCLDVSGRMEARVVLATPQLAGRINGVQWPTSAIPIALPGDSPDGGVAVRPAS